MPKTKVWLYLGLIILLALVIRVYKIGTLPLGIHLDEASWGYNAYSILKTGKDEYGVSFPIIFKAFGDQKLPVFTYSIVPFVYLFGLNLFSVRLPAALAGTLIVLLVFVILKQLKFSSSLSLIGALIAATSPWLFFLSRVFGLDATFGLLFYCLALMTMLETRQSKQQKKIFLLPVFLALTWYSYIAYRVVASLSFLVYLVLFQTKKNFPFFSRNLILVTFLFLILVLPLIKLSFSGNGVGRFKQVAYNPTLGMVLEINENRDYCTKQLPKLLCYINDNKLKTYGQTIFYRFVKTLSPEYLFLEGDKEAKFLNVTRYGMFYFFLLPFYLMGLIYLVNQALAKKMTKTQLFIMSGLFITIIPALLVNNPEKHRISPLFPFLIVIIVYGIKYIQDILKSNQAKNIYQGLLTILTLLFTFLFLTDFFVIHLHKNEIYYKNDVTKLIRYLGKQNKNTKIFIHSIDEAITLYAFINKIDPVFYQKTVQREPKDEIGFAFANKLDNLQVTTIDFKKLYCQIKNKKNKTILYATNENLINPIEFKKAQKIIYTENKVHKLQYVYNFKDLVYPENLNCN